MPVLVAASLIARAVEARAPAPVLAKMVANTGVDFVVGSIPIVGDVFDFFFKSNRMNQRMLAQHLETVVGT